VAVHCHLATHCMHSDGIGAMNVFLKLLSHPVCSACRLLPSAYGDPSCLSPELLQSWTRHLRERTSCEVLLDVFTNSTGPLPQDLLPLNTVVSSCGARGVRWYDQHMPDCSGA